MIKKKRQWLEEIRMSLIWTAIILLLYPRVGLKVVPFVLQTTLDSSVLFEISYLEEMKGGDTL